MGRAGLALLLLACAVLVVALASYETGSTDLWQHLLVGKWAWENHRPPTTHLWTWPSYGKPDLNPSWGFEVLLYPFYAALGTLGLFAWRWWTALAAFALAVLAARRLGAGPAVAALAALLGMVVARPRLQPRPETLSMVLLAFVIWVLEQRRHGGRDRSPWLVAAAWLWANVHLSYFLGLGLIGLHALEATWRARRDPTARPARLWLVLAASAAVSVLNPFGWRALWEPFRFALVESRQPVYQAIDELKGLGFGAYAREWVPLALLAWPALYAWRTLRGRRDVVEGALLVAASALAWSSRRFVIYYGVAMAPYLARALAELWESAPRRLAARAGGPVAGALAACAAAAIVLPTLTAPTPTLRLRVARNARFPGVCDFIERNDVSGRMFNQFQMAGYLLWRLWPGRLPFTDIHQAGTPEDMEAYVGTLHDPAAWRWLEDERRFDYAVVQRVPASDSLMDALGRDTSWALVFADDPSALYLKRGPRFDRLIARTAYREAQVSGPGLQRMGERAARDTLARARIRSELERMARESADNATANSLLANLAMLDGDLLQARARLDDARRVDPHLARYDERLGILALLQGDPAGALDCFRRELRRDPGTEGIEARIGEAYLAMGDPDRARAQFRKELAHHPENPVALAGLRQLEGR
jgi:tetratricopeptide (TPR) repeat protein